MNLWTVYCKHIQLVKGYHPLPPRGPAGEGHLRIWFGSGSVHCVIVLRTFAEPFIGRRPSTMVLKRASGPAAGSDPVVPNIAFWSLKSGSKCSSQAMFAFPLMRPCWWLGPADREFFAKVPRQFCEGAGKSQSAFERAGAGSLDRKISISSNLPGSASAMLAACYKPIEK